MGDRYLTTGFLSKHLGTDQKFNENNQGIGYVSPENWMVGAYMNSIGKPSVYGAKKFETDAYRLGPADLRAGLLAGAVTGYGNPITPLLMPEVSATFGERQLGLGFVPPIKGVTPAVLALQLRKKF
jgi:hypothetical protein